MRSKHCPHLPFTVNRVKEPFQQVLLTTLRGPEGRHGTFSSRLPVIITMSCCNREARCSWRSCAKVAFHRLSRRKERILGPSGPPTLASWRRMLATQFPEYKYARDHRVRTSCQLTCRAMEWIRVHVRICTTGAQTRFGHGAILHSHLRDESSDAHACEKEREC